MEIPFAGRASTDRQSRDLIRRMSLENPLWGATKIHGELLKLGIDVAQSTVSIYMVPRRDRPLQTWKTFLLNHMEGIASIDLFVVPTIGFQQLFAEPRTAALVLVCGDPQSDGRVVGTPNHRSISVGQGAEISHSRHDRAFGAAFKARVRAMGIRDRPTSFRSPWQNGFAERLIGSIRC